MQARQPGVIMPQSQKRLLEQLRQLVGTSSISSTDARWDQGNRTVIDLLAGWLADMGFGVEIQSVTPRGRRACAARRSPNLALQRGRGRAAAAQAAW